LLLDSKEWESTRKDKSGQFSEQTAERSGLFVEDGATMIERGCKITCPNCGNRFDCSDLNLYFD
jgi:hypothetical protein